MGITYAVRGVYMNMDNIEEEIIDSSGRKCYIFSRAMVYINPIIPLGLITESSEEIIMNGNQLL